MFDSHTPMQRHVMEPISFLYIKYSTLQEGTFRIESRVFKSPSERVREDLAQIERFSAARNSLGMQIRTHYLNDLLLALFGFSVTPVQTDEHNGLPTVLNKPIAFLRENLSQKVTLDQIADACNMSVSSMESKFRAITGKSVYGYMIQLRMEEAMRLLCETSYSITQIAERCGYENLFYFCNAFKKHTKMTPSEYRKSNVI